MTDSRKSRLLAFGAAFLIFAAAIALFIPTMDFFHLRLDDAGYTVNCPFVKGGLTFSNVIAAFAEPGNGAIWMPLTYMSYMADITLLGGDWAAFHFTNVILHAVNALLLFALLRRLLPKFGCANETGAVLSACAGALIWTVHPMRAEAVAWVAARKEELWTLFALLSTLAWLRFLERGGRFRYLLAFVWFLLACLSKPTALCFPLFAYAIHRLALPQRRVRLVAYLPFVLVSVALGLLTVYSQTNPTDFRQIDIYDTSFGWRLLNAAVALGLYVWHTIVPVGIHFDYRAVFEGRPLQMGLGLTVLAGALALWRLSLAAKRHPTFRRVAALAGAWFLIPLIPALGLFGIVGDHAFADRYSYLSAGALSLVLAVGLGRIFRARAKAQDSACRRVLGFVVAVGLLAVVAGEVALAWPVVQSFKNDLSAFSRVLAFDSNHWRALHFVGAEYCARAKRYDEGLKMIRRSLELSPRPSTAATLAYLLAYRGQMGDFAEVKRLGATVAKNPQLDREGMMLDALGVAAFREGDDRSAVAYLSAALSAPRRQHTKSHAMLNLGLALANIGCDREALGVLRELRQLRDKWVRERATSAILTLSQRHPHPRFGWQQ